MQGRSSMRGENGQDLGLDWIGGDYVHGCCVVEFDLVGVL
jgi:hypothetical protein